MLKMLLIEGLNHNLEVQMGMGPNGIILDAGQIGSWSRRSKIDAEIKWIRSDPNSVKSNPI